MWERQHIHLPIHIYVLFDRLTDEIPRRLSDDCFSSKSSELRGRSDVRSFLSLLRTRSPLNHVSLLSPKRSHESRPLMMKPRSLADGVSIELFR